MHVPKIYANPMMHRDLLESLRKFSYRLDDAADQWDNVYFWYRRRFGDHDARTTEADNRGESLRVAARRLRGIW